MVENQVKTHRDAERASTQRRAVELAEYIVENQTTVRTAAKQFGVSKSTVHMDVAQRLRRMNPGLYNEVRQVLDVNKSERHLRGGMATREKYQGLQLSCEE
ncbi:MAG: sporulation transcriptional regulator SpoIIID [Oscillospiraceae bacterium]|nr:sporulation transcriptional regulator SpoIIID [Oscillospiraceae bacterium]